MEFKVATLHTFSNDGLRINRNIMEFKEKILEIEQLEKNRINRNIMEFKVFHN